MRDYKAEYEGRVAFIRELVKSAGASGIVYGNSGGKDSALVGILCKAACDNTVGIIMPCASKRNYGQDTDDGIAVAERFGIETRTVDLTAVDPIAPHDQLWTHSGRWWLADMLILAILGAAWTGLVRWRLRLPVRG